MKILIPLLFYICFLISCSVQTAGTVDDVGSLSGRLLSDEGDLISYPVNVTLYRVTGSSLSDNLSGISGMREIFKTIETSTGSFVFDSLPETDFQIEVTNDDIIVANDDVRVTIATPAADSIEVSDVISLPFMLMNSDNISVKESLIENCKVSVTIGGYVVKTVKAKSFSFKMLVTRNATTDTVKIHANIEFNDAMGISGSNKTVRFSVIEGPADLVILPLGSDTTKTTDYSGMKLIPAGTFIMGPDSNNYGTEYPSAVFRQTTLTEDFWMDSTEVTQKQFRDLMVKWYPDYELPDWETIGWGVGDNYGAHSISWIDAVLYCNARTKEAGSTDTVYRYDGFSPHTDSANVKTLLFDNIVIDLSREGYHLPTEAQWEYACRAGTETDYYFTTTRIDLYAWCRSNSDTCSHPVALKLPNTFGLYDMCGNLNEWCNDYIWPYDPNETTDPIGNQEPHPSETRIRRGGAWDTDSRNRSFDRLPHPYYTRIPPNGFRTCKTVH